MADVFISYKREERQAVERLAQELRRLGLDVWFDASLNAGEAFSDEIDREAHAAKTILVCWSPTARESKWVKAEALIGFEHGKLAACYVAGPDGFYPPTPFNSIHAEDLRAWVGAPSNTHAGYKSILRRIGTLCGRADIESYGALDVQAPPSTLRAWIERHQSSPLFMAVDELLHVRDVEEAERARLEQEARERRAREEAERHQRERIERERVEKEQAARREKDEAARRERERRSAQDLAEAEERERQSERKVARRRARQSLLSSLFVIVLSAATVVWLNRETVIIWAAETTARPFGELTFEAPPQSSTFAGNQPTSIRSSEQTYRVSATGQDLRISTGAVTARIGYGYDNGTEPPWRCSLTAAAPGQLVICLWEGYGFGTMGIVEPEQSREVDNLLRFDGAELGLNSDCVGREYAGDGEPECFAAIPNENLLLFVGHAGDGVGSNLFLVNLGERRSILPRTTSLVAGLSMRLRTLPSRPQGLDPFFDNKYSVASLPGAECYTWSRPQSYAISELTNTLVVRGNVQIECIRQTAGAPDPVRTTEEPVTWYFSL